MQGSICTPWHTSQVISDCGCQFACGAFRTFAKEWCFEHVTSSSRHPKANGKAESAVKIVKNLCRRAAFAGEDPWKAILHWRNIGQPIRMKPLPGDRTGRWKKGVCLQQAGPRSYVVNVEGTTYRRSRVDLRPAERVPSLSSGHLEHSPEHPGNAHATEGGSASEDSSEETGTSHGGATHSSQTSCTPHRAEQGQAYSRSGRLIKPWDRLNF